ncbi:MAG: hypothetical protein HZB13_08165 [Acidobacteria bacterium]|nr:hypothetical protein [Acidobacteriota bacterium]
MEASKSSRSRAAACSLGTGARGGWDDDLERHGFARAEFDEAAEKAADVHVAFAHAGPVDLGAGVVVPDVGVPDVAGEDVGGEGFEREVGILEDPARVAGVEAGSDDVFAGAFDQDLQLASLKVAGVVLDGDAEAHIAGARGDRAQDPDGVLDASFNAAGGLAVGGGALESANQLGAGKLGGPEDACELFLGRAGLRVEGCGGGADGAHADLKLDAELAGMVADLLHMVVFQRAEKADLREVNRGDAEPGAVVEVLKGGPALRAQAEEVDAQLDAGRRGGQRCGGQGGGQKLAAEHEVHYAASCR